MRTVEGQLGYEYSKKIFKQLDAVTPGTSSNISAQPQLYEIHAPQAPTVYVEVDFHDVPMVANWIIHNLDVIADAIARGVCDCFGVFQSTRPLRGGTAILHKKTVQNIAYCTKSAFTLAVLSGFLALMRPFFLPNVHKFRCEPSEESLLAPRSHAYTIRTPSG